MASTNTKNLVIVESPAKSKTIKKYLGKGFEVKASYGHVADLVKKNMGVDKENNFSPTYEISSDKKKVIRELKALAKKAETVRIATDEDREGEAIGRHVAQALKLDIDSTPRIVFHEITKPAIQKAIKNPRTIDVNLVNAQQARRILDRLVGFELSPVLWKKIQGGLSAGRVQSVAVRILVDREREIQAFTPTSSFKVEATCLAKGQSFQAKLSRKPKKAKTVMDFLEEAKVSTLTVKKLETKPGTKTPSAPFTTSTLQQEASRKLNFAVGQTMRIAQKLYEAGHITYMRTDSVNISQTAIDAARTSILKNYGKEYSKPTTYNNKKSNAQEAHECIRPTDFSKEHAGANGQEKRLYDLIRKRAIASQMSKAKIQKTTATIHVSLSKKELIAKGEMIAFDGFLKVYMESSDDEQEDQETKDMLPPMEEGQIIKLDSIVATEQFKRHPSRYTEASLVKKLEKEGIGRPSTYAPTIATIQKRGYAVLEDRPGIEKTIQVLSLKKGSITQKTETKIYGAEKKKLFPTDMGLLVNEFLCKHFPDIVDYTFTAQVEDEFDQIAQGKLEWTKMLHEFYTPFHQTVEKTTDEADRFTGERELGIHPKYNKPVIARMGRYGPLVQIGDAEDEDKKYAKLMPGLSLEDVTLEEALECFALPRTLGTYKDEEIQANIGRYGPYIRRGKLFVSLKATEEHPDDDPYKVELERAIELVEAKIKANKEKIIQEHEHKGKRLAVEKGRRGPFIRYGKRNVKLPKELKEKPESLTLEQLIEIVEG